MVSQNTTTKDYLNYLKDCLIKPIVSSTNSPTYNIAKFIIHFLNNSIDFNFKYIIKNREQLIYNLNNLTLVRKHTMLSLNVNNI